MGAELEQAAVVDDAHAVGALRGGEAVGDHDHRPALHEPLHRGLDLGLGARVEVRRRLV